MQEQDPLPASALDSLHSWILG